ncbi:hypothetical protein GWI33_014858 [Rhynchophorus ferrugineus]|uniref:C2H2-type domain-containing protein n=1 Tax=Rhynchophorus ferrugineus TaxID=354439 RepID=A0A834MBX5_RHYFE|nr:hypothetical protein GWI33_014858 [Rhynchophorus ferrugineus]
MPFFLLGYYFMQHTCEECGKQYKHAKNLDRHKRFECKREKKFHCLYCDYAGYQKIHVNVHISRRHKDMMDPNIFI